MNGRKTVIIPLLAILALLPIASPMLAGPASQSGIVTAITHVTVIPMDSERAMDDHTVLVEDGAISAVGPTDEVPVPEGAQVIDGTGKYLMPGLADMHVHTNKFGSPDHLVLYLAHGVTIIRNLNVSDSHRAWREQIASGEIRGPTMLVSGPSLTGFERGGISPMQIFGGRALVWAIALVPLLLGVALFWLVLRLGGRSGGLWRKYGWLSLAGAAVIALLVPVLRIIPVQTTLQWFTSAQAYAENPREARLLVKQQIDNGVDFIKAYNSSLPQVYLTYIAEAEEQGAYTMGHLLDAGPKWVSLDETFAAGLDEVAHAHEYQDYFFVDYDPATPAGEEPLYDLDMERIDEVADLVARYDVGVTANLVTVEMTALRNKGDRATWYARPEYATLPPGLVEAWIAEDRFVDDMDASELDEFLTYIEETVQPWEWAFTRALHERGLPVVLGTDVGVEGIVPGYSAHHELELLVEAGFTPFEALSTGTSTAAEVAGRMGADDAFGTVETGNRADLVLLSANPLEDITNSLRIEGVMLRGQWFTQAELQAMVEELVASYEDEEG
jgi:cytosine/adenosine deaminase-related metal-dependent hydrolase